MSNHTPKRRPARKCGDCGHYKALIYRDGGEDAFCGRCMLPADRTRRVRSMAKKACEHSLPREGNGNGGAGRA